MNTELKMQAKAIATAAQQEVGIALEAIMGIVTIALQLMPQVMALCGGNATPKQRASNHFDETSGTFDRGAIHSLFPTLREAQAKHNEKTGERVRLDRRQLKVLAIKTLTQAKDEDESTGVACMAAAKQMSSVE